MSTETILLSSKIYLIARVGVVVWALGNVSAFLIFWVSAALGQTQPAWFQVNYDGLGAAGANAMVFVLQGLALACLLYAQWCAFKALGLLEAPARDYSNLVRYLARFSTALFLYAIGATVLMIVRASLAEAAVSGDVSVVIAIDADRITLLIVSFVLYCVTNALRVADDAVEETQSFL